MSKKIIAFAKENILSISILLFLIFIIVSNMQSNPNDKCSTIERDDLKEICIAERDIKNDTNCEKFKYDTTKKYCYVSIAAITKNPSICANNPDLSDECYWSYSIGFLDFSVCRMIKEDFWRNSCYYEIIEKLDEMTSIRCNELSNKIHANPGLCKSIVCTSSYKNIDFLNACWAASLHNSTYCENIEDIELKTQCYKKTPEDNFLTCLKISDEIERNKCLYRLSVETNNKSICEYINDSKLTKPGIKMNYRPNCFNHFIAHVEGIIKTEYKEGKEIITLNNYYCLVGPYAQDLKEYNNKKMEIIGNKTVEYCVFGKGRTITVTQFKQIIS